MRSFASSPSGTGPEARSNRKQTPTKAAIFSINGWRIPAAAPRDVPMRIAIASDHAAVALKADLVAWLSGEGHQVDDLGPEGVESVDYPDYGYKLAEAVAAGRADFGIALCGSGIGISIAANRHPGCRCARVDEPLSAALAREHNDANVIALGARMIGIEMAQACIAAFLATQFGGGRHVRRVEKLTNPPFAREPV